MNNNKIIMIDSTEDLNLKEEFHLEIFLNFLNDLTKP